jgi:hypothetical protein
VDLRLRGVVVALTFGIGVASGAATGIGTTLQMLRRDPLMRCARTARRSRPGVKARG